MWQCPSGTYFKCEKKYIQLTMKHITAKGIRYCPPLVSLTMKRKSPGNCEIRIYQEPFITQQIFTDHLTDIGGEDKPQTNPDLMELTF